MNVAVILAAGKGLRAGGELPKQFVSVQGKMIIEYSLTTFQNHPAIDEVAIVVSPEYMSLIQQLKDKSRYSKLKQILQGGAERYQSSWAAIQHYAQYSDCQLLIHDAARPLISSEVISSVLDTLKHNNCAIVAIPATDTVLYSEDEQHIASVPPRKKMFYAQTPQAFRLETIKKAFEIGLKDEQFNPTDDSSVVLRYLPDEKIAIVLGEAVNRKITFKEDLNWLNSQ